MLIKKLETDYIPMPGIQVQDEAWSDSKDIIQMGLNLEKNNNYYFLEFEEITDNVYLSTKVDWHKQNGWEEHRTPTT
jgi:hypothetical protein